MRKVTKVMKTGTAVATIGVVVEDERGGAFTLAQVGVEPSNLLFVTHLGLVITTATHSP